MYYICICIHLKPFSKSILSRLVIHIEILIALLSILGVSTIMSTRDHSCTYITDFRE